MAFVSGEVFFVNQEVVVGVKFPESTVKHIEVFVREVLPNLIYVFFVGHLEEDIGQIRVLKVAPRDLPVVVSVELVKNAHNDCVSVPLLELRGGFEELQSRMGL